MYTDVFSSKEKQKKSNITSQTLNKLLYMMILMQKHRSSQIKKRLLKPE